MEDKIDVTPTNSMQYFLQLCRFCSICKSELFADSNPHLLPCLHTCCGQCLEDIKAFEVESKSAVSDRMPQSTSNQKSEKDPYPKCEECKEVFKSSDCILNVFLLNYFAVQKKGSRVSESDKSGKEASDNEVDWDAFDSCASCEEKSELAAYCKDCEGAICGACFKQHSTMKAFRKHEPVERSCDEKKSIENFVKQFTNCSKHEKEQYTLYCLMCETVTCKECLIQFHKDHRWENIGEMKNCFVKEIDLNRRSISEKRELVVSSLRSLESRQTQINLQRSSIRNEILKCANSLKNAVTELSQTLFEELEKHCDKRKSEYSKTQENLKGTEESLRFVEMFLNDIVDTNFPVGLLYTKKLIQTQISNLLQKQCFNPNSHEEFDLKLTPSMAVFRLENLIKTAWTISSSKGGQNSTTSADGNASVGSERISQKRNSDDIEIINSVPAKRPPQQSPLAACKQFVDNVSCTQCTTSASLSYTASLPQTVSNNYPLHTNIAMVPNSAAAYPVMFAGSQPLIPHINQIQSSGASNTSNSRSMCPPNVSLQPPRYSTIHTAVPNQCSQSLLPRATVPQTVHSSQPTLIPNLYIANGIFEYQQQRSQVNFQPQPNPVQSQSIQQMNSRRENRVNSIRTTPIGSELTHQQQPSQSPKQTNISQHRIIAPNLVPQVPPKPPTNMIQPKTVPNVPATQRSQMPQISISKQKIMEHKIVEQKKAQQSVQLVTILPPPSENENTDNRQISQNSHPTPNENGINTTSQLHDLLSKNTNNNENNCQIYPPAANGQQSQSTSTIGLFQSRQTTTNTEPVAASVDGSVTAPVKSKTHMRIQSPPSPPVTEKPTETQSTVTSTVSVDTENGSVTSSTANGAKPLISKRMSEVTTQVVSTTENGYKITFTPSTNGLSSDTETLQESPVEADDDDDVENDIYCSVCKDGGELIFCEKCPRSFHMDCHIPVLHTMPNAAWTCQLCNTVPADIRRSIGPNASQVNQVACRRILLEMFCLKESAAMRKDTTRNNLKTVKDNLENKSNYTEQDFIRDINSLFRGFYSEQKSHNENYECAIVLEKKFKELVENYLPQHKSMVKMKIWEIGSNSRLKKPRAV